MKQSVKAQYPKFLYFVSINANHAPGVKNDSTAGAISYHRLTIEKKQHKNLLRNYKSKIVYILSVAMYS